MMKLQEVTMGTRVIALVAGLALTALADTATAACVSKAGPVGGSFFDCSSSQVFNIVPPGQNGTYNLADFLAAEAGQGFPAHTRDQEPLYAGLLNVAPNVTAADIGTFYKDASFLTDLTQA